MTVPVTEVVRVRSTALGAGLDPLDVRAWLARRLLNKIAERGLTLVPGSADVVQLEDEGSGLVEWLMVASAS